jgi:Ca2+-binding RTX toxin-like protein
LRPGRPTGAGGGTPAPQGTAGADTLTGNAGANTLNGLAGDDRLDGAGGDEIINGGDGDDVMVHNLGGGEDIMDGGAGRDTAEVNGSAAQGAQFDLAAANAGAVRFEGVNLSTGKIEITNTEVIQVNGQGFSETLSVNDISASPVQNVIFNGGGGADTVNATNTNVKLTTDGGAGNDTALGGRGADDLRGGDGNDILQGQDGDDRIRGDNGDDQITGDRGNDFLGGNFGDDQIDGGDGDDQIFGNHGADRLNGGNGDDFLYGGVGNDDFTGGDGNDRFLAGAGTDVIQDFPAGAGVVDQLDLTPFSFADTAAVLAVTSDIGGSAVIQISATDTIRLAGVATADLLADDFIL